MEFWNDQTAVLLIDLQRDFLEASGRMPVEPEDAEVVVTVANRLLAHAQRVGWLPIFIKNEFSPNDGLGNLLRRGAAIAGSRGAEVDPRVSQPPDAPAFSKCRADAFTNPALQTFLQENEIHNLIAVGVMAEACVRATVRHAIRLGYQVTVIPEAVPSDRQWKKVLAFWDMRRAGAQFVAAETIVQHRGKAELAHPHRSENQHSGDASP
jgi:nicotinamidase-related amidase